MFVQKEEMERINGGGNKRAKDVLYTNLKLKISKTMNGKKRSHLHMPS
jgi:hypothetical protein